MVSIGVKVKDKIVEDQIKEEIANSQRGSDIYGLVEMMAFDYHLRDKSRSADDNWFMAVDKLGEWSEYQVNRMSSVESPLEDSIHQLLCHRAYYRKGYADFWGEDSSSFDNWVYVQKELAGQIMPQVTI